MAVVLQIRCLSPSPRRIHRFLGFRVETEERLPDQTARKGSHFSITKNCPILNTFHDMNEGVRRISEDEAVGLAHLEGYRVEKNGLFAYYWLRVAEGEFMRTRGPEPCPRPSNSDAP
jgi:hypothetical protein